MLKIFLFGQPKLFLEETLIKFNAPPRALPLLGYLLLHRNQALERQQVAFTLWPDEPESAARANLRRHIHQLQRLMPPVPPDCPWLAGDARTIQWNPQAESWLDVAEFERLANHPASLAEAVELYTGDLLESVYDDWVFFERERLRERCFAALGQLVFQQRASRNFPAAIQFAQQILGRDPFREDALRQLIALRYESGDRAGAIQEFDAFERRLRREMGVAPMPETRALHESVLRNASLSSGCEAARAPGPGRAGPGSARALPFVGREAEMVQLSARWNQAARGRGGLVLVGGEAGVGKTRLARQMSLLAEQQGGRVFYGRTDPGESHPYQAMLETFQAALPLLATLEGVPVHLAALAALLPELRVRRSLPGLVALDPDRERARLFDAAATCLACLAEPRPLLLILEDLHWAGEASAALLEFLARRAAGCALLIVGTYRDEETPRAHPLRSLRRRLQADKLVDALPIGRLSAGAVESLVNQAVGPNPGLAARLLAESEGNPLFLEMLWRQWQETGTGQDSLPGGVRAAIQKRLAGLPATARAYAEVAAVLGPAFEGEVAREVGGWDEAQAHTALGELLDASLARYTESRSRFDYIFSHHLIQAALYDEIPPARRRLRHQRAAEVLESLYPEQAGELALHYDLGGIPARAIPRYLKAARQRLAIFADAEALESLGRALQLAGESPASCTRQGLAELLLEREDILARRAEREAQLADLQCLEELASQMADGELFCEVHNRQVRYHRSIDNRPAHKQAVLALQEQARAQGSLRWQATAVFAAGIFAKIVNEFPEAISELEEACGLYSQLKDIPGQVACYSHLTEIYIIRRQSSLAEACTRQALALCDRNIPTANLMQILWNFSANRLLAREHERCLSYARELLGAAERASDRVWQAAAHRLMGMACQHMFQVAEARQHLRTALDLYRLCQKTKGCALTFQSLGLVEISVGNFAAATGYYEQAFEIQERLADSNGMASELINLGFAAASKEDFQAEGDYARRAAALTRKIGNDFLESLALQALGESEIAAGDLPTARQHLEQALALQGDPNLVTERVSIWMDQAGLLWKSGEPPRALELIERVLDSYPQMEGTDDNLHRHLWAAAQILRAAGQAERAGKVLAQAYQAFRKDLAAIPDAESRQSFAAIRHNRQIAAAHERGEWA